MDEFVFSCLSRRCVLELSSEAAEFIDHPACCIGSDPDVAVNYPYQIAFGFTICTAHVSDLGIGAQVCFMAVSSGKVWVVILDQYPCVKCAEVIDKASQDR